MGVFNNLNLRVSDNTQDKSPKEHRVSMNWTQQLKRVFSINAKVCNKCGRVVKIITWNEDILVIKKIPDYLETSA